MYYFYQAQIDSYRNRGEHIDRDMQPPENFRILSIVPTRDDLMDSTPFVRPNIVQGAYNDVEHYLDVQFRLLREDCFGPIRDGISKNVQKEKKKIILVFVFSWLKFLSFRLFREILTYFLLFVYRTVFERTE